MALPFYFYIFSFIFGAVIGSFLNVCICRLPKGESVVFPASHCPACNTSIAFHDNIPLVSWLLLRGKCRACSIPISFQYPLVELVTALLTLFLFLRFGPTFSFVALFLFCAAMVVITFIDIEHQIIPNRITGPGIVLGFLFSFVREGLSWPTSMIGLLAGGGSLFLVFYGYLRLTGKLEDEKSETTQNLLMVISCLPAIIVGLYCYRRFPALIWPDSLLGILLGGGIIWAIAELYYLLRKDEGMGGGDIKLLAMMGAFFGWKAIPFIIFISSLVGSVIGITVMIMQKKDAKLAIPFGPFLAFGAILYIFYGRQMIQWYLSLGGHG